MKSLYNKNKNICTIVSDTPYSKNKDGKFVGLDPTVEEIDHLASLFKYIYHFAPLHSSNPPQSYIKHQKTNIEIIPMIPVGGSNIFDKVKHILIFPFHMKKLMPYLGKAEVIHFRAPMGFGVLFLPLLLIFSKKKIWIKYAGSWESNDVPLTYKFQRWLLYHFKNNAVITINSSTKNLKKNFFQLSNPCFRKKIIEDNKSEVRNKNFSNGLNVVFVGRVEKRKGIDDIFKIFQKLGSIRNIKSLKIIGESKRKDYYKQKAATISSKISILGPLSRKDIFKIYSESHVLILLSKSEGFPKVIMEAGVFGCVPIVSNFYGIAEVIEHGVNGFIMNSYNSKYNYKDFKLVFEDLDSLKTCSMNIFKRSHSYSYEEYLQNIENAILS